MVKKKRSIAQANDLGKQETEESRYPSEEKVTVATEQREQQLSEKGPIFKDPKFIPTGKSGTIGKRTRIWKSLKQITAADRLLPLPARDISYSNIETPPSMKPTKKYSDISGLQAKYRDPLTKLRYANSDEFAKIRTLSPDIINGYLLLRRANNPVS